MSIKLNFTEKKLVNKGSFIKVKFEVLLEETEFHFKPDENLVDS